MGRFHSFQHVFAIAVLTVVLVAPVSIGALATAAGAATPTCTSSHLTLSVGRGDAAAGNEGFPLLIHNRGSATCSLDGFATVTMVTEKSSPKPVRVVHTSESQICPTSKPSVVILKSGAEASFGISYGDAYNQEPGNNKAPGCLVTEVRVALPNVLPTHVYIPIRSTSSSGAINGFNVCFANYRFGETPIESGLARHA